MTGIGGSMADFYSIFGDQSREMGVLQFINKYLSEDPDLPKISKSALKRKISPELLGRLGAQLLRLGDVASLAQVRRFSEVLSCRVSFVANLMIELNVAEFRNPQICEALKTLFASLTLSEKRKVTSKALLDNIQCEREITNAKDAYPQLRFLLSLDNAQALSGIISSEMSFEFCSTPSQRLRTALADLHREAIGPRKLTRSSFSFLTEVLEFLTKDELIANFENLTAFQTETQLIRFFRQTPEAIKKKLEADQKLTAGRPTVNLEIVDEHTEVLDFLRITLSVEADWKRATQLLRESVQSRTATARRL